MTALRDYNSAVDFVDRHVAEGRGDKVAFIDPSRNLTYGELRDSAARIGPMLARMGIMHGSLPGWILLKLGIWLVLAASIAVVYRGREIARALIWAVPLLAAAAGATALLKPF